MSTKLAYRIYTQTTFICGVSDWEFSKNMIWVQVFNISGRGALNFTDINFDPLEKAIVDKQWAL